MSSFPFHSIHTLSTLSVTDITGKRVISIVKKHTEDNSNTSAKHETLTTEIYFIAADTTDDHEVLKLIKY